MLKIILIAALAILSIECYLMGSITSFIQRRVLFADILKLLISAIIVSIFFTLGIYLGNIIEHALPQFSNWYSATLFFIFSIKMMYDGFKLYKIKRSVNPINWQGFSILTSVVSINGFLIGLGFGLLGCELSNSYFSIIILTFSTLVGYLIGFRIKKLNQGRYELFAAVFYLIIAIIIAINK